MVQARACSRRFSVRVIRRVLTGLTSVRIDLEDAIIFDAAPGQHVRNTRIFLSRPREHNLKAYPWKAIIGAPQVTFLCHSIYMPRSVPDPKKVEASDRTQITTDVSPLRSLLGGLSNKRKLLPNFAKRLRPVIDMLK